MSQIFSKSNYDDIFINIFKSEKHFYLKKNFSLMRIIEIYKEVVENEKQSVFLPIRRKWIQIAQ